MVFSNLISANADGHFEYFFQLVASNRACCRASGASWADYDNDGLLDLVVVFAKGARLFHNEGEGLFVEDDLPGAVAPESMGDAAWGDYDNDGFLDLIIADRFLLTPKGGRNTLYHNDGNRRFSRIDAGSIANDLGHSWSVAWGDYDNNGFIDLFVASRDYSPNLLYRNNGNANHWLKIALVGASSNRSGIGAKLRLIANVGGKRLEQRRDIGSKGCSPQGGLIAHFGVADATLVDELSIEWPSGFVQRLARLPVDGLMKILEPPSLKVGRGWTPNGFELVLKDVGGMQCNLEQSKDLVEWTLLNRYSGVTNTITVLDGSASPREQKFYRILRQQ